VIVAMAAMRVVKTAVHQVINVIAMRDGFMAAARAMAMGVLVDVLCAPRRILGTHFDDMLFGMSGARMHEVAILQIIDVILVAHSNMTTVRAILMGVRALHFHSPLQPDD
jgi:hypothetical protein